MSDVTRFDEEKETEENTPCLGVKERIQRKMWSQRHVGLDVLMACWGLGTWLGVNGLYVQLPLLVERLPEGWALPSSMVLAVQMANIGLLVYGALRNLFPKAPDAPYIYALLSIGIISLTLNSFVYDKTVSLGASETSIAFLALTFSAALVGCTSSVLFYPYLRHFRDVYLATYLVGEGLSGFVPSTLALIQGVGGDPECVLSADNSTLTAVYAPPRFEISTFMLLLGGLSALSLVSFTAVDNLRTFQSERVAVNAAQKDDEAVSAGVSLVQPKWLLVLVLMACLNALSNGVLPSVQSYSCMPYGTTAYHLAVTLGAMANPAACLAGVWLRPVPPRWLAAALLAVLLPFGYILATASLSPTPPLQGTGIGITLVVLSWVLTSATVSYARMWVYGWARQGGAKGMRACGAVTQVGSALGSLLLFLLVNYAKVFVEPDRCPAPV